MTLMAMTPINSRAVLQRPDGLNLDFPGVVIATFPCQPDLLRSIPCPCIPLPRHPSYIDISIALQDKIPMTGFEKQ
jgi:hypothetical protein